MERFSRRASARLRLIVFVPFVVIAASCGSDDSSTSTTPAPAVTTAQTTSAPAPTTAAPTTAAPVVGRLNAPGSACIGSGDGKGAPIVVGSIQTDSSAGAGFPEISAGAKACFAAINATGGINGHPIDFKPCNDSADPIQGEACARDLIDAGAVAVLGGICFSCFSAPVVDVLGKGGVPYVGGLPVLPPEYKQENFFAITNGGGSSSLRSNATYILQAAKGKGVQAKVVEINAGVGEIDPTLENQIKTLGGDYAGRVNFDPASADLASVAQQAIDLKPNYISVQTDGPNTVKIVTSLRTQGYEGDIVILGTASDPQSIEGMGEAAEGVFVASFFKDLSTGTTPDALKFQADMTASGADPSKTLAGTGYAAAFVTAEALFNVEGEVTAATFTAALLKIDGLQALFAGQLSYKNATPDFPRTFYFTAYGNAITAGKVVPSGPAFNWLTGETVG